MNDSNVAVLGLGLIGSIWAENYRADGVLAAAWSRSPKPNLPIDTAGLEECTKRAACLQLCLYDADSVREVLDRLLPLLDKRHTLIQSTTIDAAGAAEFAEKVRQTGARYLEAPFTGSKPAAKARQTVFYLGGETEDVRDAEPLLARISKTRFHIGTPAQAASIKLAMNLQIAGITEALCESITMTRSAGIEDDIFFEVLRRNVAWSGLAQLKEPKLRSGDFAPQFSIKNMHKDMRLAKDSADTRLPLLETLTECLAAAEAAGYGEDDFLSLIRELSGK